MARRSSRGAASRRHPRSITVSLDVPARFAHRVPESLVARPPRQRLARRSWSVVPLALSAGPTVRKSVKVKYFTNWKVKPSYTIVSRRRGKPVLKIASAKRVNRLLSTEFNRRRYDQKTRRKVANAGQLDSLSRDTYGLIAANRFYGVSRIADAALVTRALGG